MFGARGFGGESDLGRRIGNDPHIPYADGVAAGAHAGYGRHVPVQRAPATCIFAVLAGKARAGCHRPAPRPAHGLPPCTRSSSAASPPVHGEWSPCITMRPDRIRSKAGIGRRIDPGIQADGGTGAAVESAHQARADIAARQRQTHHQRQQQEITQIVRIAPGEIEDRAARRGQAFPLRGAWPGAVARAIAVQKRIARRSGDRRFPKSGDA